MLYEVITINKTGSPEKGIKVCLNVGDMIINNEEEDMNSEKNEALPSDEIVISKIYTIRGKKVMLDRDLACLYNVETRVLNQAVKRNEERFPQDFMFQMTREELKDWT